MSKRNGHMRLGAFLYDVGHHTAAWRYPEAPERPALDYEYLFDCAQIAERGKFDMVFFQDSMAVNLEDVEPYSRLARGGMQFDPTMMLAALSSVTKRIGLAATISTTYTEPYHVARKFGTLDVISGGRAAWNLVTSTALGEAANFGKEQNLAHGDRYQRASEFADVVRGLWDSWEDDAFVNDKASGRFFDADKVQVLHHKGKHFLVRGPLGISRSPQGRPVIIVAATSEPGRELAARVADVMFTEQPTLDSAKEFYRDVKERVVRHSRSPDELCIMPGASILVEHTTQEAKDKFEQLQDLIDPVVGVSLLGNIIDIDFRGYPVDGPVPDLPLNERGNISRQKRFFEMARRDRLTIRQLYQHVVGARGHWTIIGDPVEVADQLEERYQSYGADGFNIMPALLPDALNKFVELVLPELRRRGLFRSEYEGRTLRHHLQLSKPQHSDASDINASAVSD